MILLLFGTDITSYIQFIQNVQNPIETNVKFVQCKQFFGVNIPEYQHFKNEHEAFSIIIISINSNISPISIRSASVDSRNNMNNKNKNEKKKINILKQNRCTLEISACHTYIHVRKILDRYFCEMLLSCLHMNFYECACFRVSILSAFGTCLWLSHSNTSKCIFAMVFSF